MKRKTLATLCISLASLCSSHHIYAQDNTNQQKLIPSLLENVIIPDIDRAQNAITALKTAINTPDAGDKRSPAVDKDFTSFIKSWKAVQAVYIAGEIESGAIDTPRLMDTYHEGNEKLDEQIARALKSSDEPNIALFKNTFKSINALAIVLYADDTLSETEKRYADFILTTLSNHLSTIKEVYASDAEVLHQDPDQLMSFVLNALIDSSFKLKEWRIGEPSGLAKKYKGKVDSRRQEYPLSKKSIAAAHAIIDAHDAVMGKQAYENLGSIASKQGAQKEVENIQNLIHTAQEQLSTLESENVSDFSDPRMKDLYETLGKLNDAYYQSLVKALPVQAKILDADGD